MNQRPSSIRKREAHIDTQWALTKRVTGTLNKSHSVDHEHPKAHPLPTKNVGSRPALHLKEKHLLSKLSIFES